MAQVREKQGQLVFGLDIGTRSIVGTVGKMEGDRFHVMAQESLEHETRSMLDGQIHDIGKVGETISRVKAMLEEKLERTLTDVCIAAAGRVLRTVSTHVEQTFETEKEITTEDIYDLSTLGVQKAYEEFQGINDTQDKFYCVGYTPVRFYMNGYQITNLEGHKAKTIGIDLIGTFLPDDVVDGLYKAVEKADLQVANLTLEPIAAIQVAIPEKFRLLNMALVDVGAGTSDICITKEGTITAYGMIPVAGDSLTELLVQHCLVEFETAEKIKRSIGTSEEISYEDIFGLPQTITSQEALDVLLPKVEEMAGQVADEIKKLNGDKPVSAVFVVGGGGMVPGYTGILAKKLGIVESRVAIRGKEVLQAVSFDMENARKDSMMVTPVGICLSFYEQSNNFIFVEFNGSRVKLYDNGHLTVADAAVQSSFPNEDLFPKRGRALTFTVDGKQRITRGQVGEACVILKNGETADLYTKLRNSDRIEVKPSTAGEEAHLRLSDIMDSLGKMELTINGNRITLPKRATVNGKEEPYSYEIKEQDEIVIQHYYTVEELARMMELPIGGQIMINDAPAKEDTRVYENFTLSYRVGEMDAENPAGDTEDGNANGTRANKELEKEEPGQTQTAENKELQVIVNHEPVVLQGKPSYVFVDVFDAIHFDLKKSGGKSIVTKVNHQQAEYMQELKSGDLIEIYWSEV